MSAETAPHDFLDAFYRGDADAARAYLADDFEFTGPFVSVTGADRYLASAGPLLAAVRDTTVRQTWSAGDEVCVVHDVALRDTSEPITMADWFTVREGRLVRERVVFDSAPLRTALANAAPSTARG